MLWFKRNSAGEVVTRARLVARGYEEEDDIPSDSPTLDQINLKLIIMIAQAENMKVTTADVKAAFLQGLPLTERTVFVIPPPEANVPKGRVWRLRVSLYGLDDASLRFYWKVREVMKKLSFKQSRFDPALFYDKDKKTGKLRGLIGTHVDDFLIAGNDEWRENIISNIKTEFLLGTIEEKDFLYCGHRIRQFGDRMTLDRDEFAEKVVPLIINPARRRQGDDKVTGKERQAIRSYAGKLGWLGRTTRPELLVSQIKASTA